MDMVRKTCADCGKRRLCYLVSIAELPWIKIPFCTDCVFDLIHAQKEMMASASE